MLPNEQMSLPELLCWCSIWVDNLRFYNQDDAWMYEPLVSDYLRWYSRQMIVDDEYRYIEGFLRAETQRQYELWLKSKK